MKKKNDYIKDNIEETFLSKEFNHLDRDLVLKLISNTLINENDREKIKRTINDITDTYVNKKNKS